MVPWTIGVDLRTALLAFEWALLLLLATLVGHLAQRALGLPKMVGYAVLGAVAGLLGKAGASWPLTGVGLFLLELGIAVVLFEAGARLPLRWFRHNPRVLVQSLAESVLTFAVAYYTLRALGLDLKTVRALSIIAVAASPAVLMRVAHDLRAGGPVTDRAVALTTLNTLYALTLGTAMLHSIDRGDDSLLASVGFSLTVLGISALAGAVLATLLTIALRLLRPTSRDNAIIVLTLVAACVAATDPLGGSAPLATLLAGLTLRQIHPRPWMWPRQLGTAASMLNILMFVLVSSMAVRGRWELASLGIALALIAARAATKAVSLLATGFGSGMGARQLAWTGATMVPMSAVALLLTSEFVVASRSVGIPVAEVALPMILITELMGAVLVSLALRGAGETTPQTPRARMPSRLMLTGDEDTQP